MHTYINHMFIYILVISCSIHVSNTYPFALTHTRPCTHTHPYTNTHARPCTHTYAYTHTRIHTHTHTHTPIHTYTHTHMRPYTHTHTHTRPHTHTHTHTHTYSHTPPHRGIVRRDSIWDKLVFHKVQANLGGNIRVVISGSAPLSDKVLKFVRAALGVTVIEGQMFDNSFSSSSTSYTPTLNPAARS